MTMDFLKTKITAYDGGNPTNMDKPPSIGDVALLKTDAHEISVLVVELIHPNIKGKVLTIGPLPVFETQEITRDDIVKFNTDQIFKLTRN